MFHIIKPGTNFDFVGRRWVWLGLSIAALIGVFVLLATKGLNYGIDFTGGAEIQVKVPVEWNIAKLRKTLSQGGLKGVRVQQIGGVESTEYLIKAQGDEKSLNATSQKVGKVLATAIPKDQFELQRVDVVGPAAGESLRNSGLLSMFYALLCILVYVAIRFDSRYAPGAILALFHDSLITLGIFILTQKQFDLTILAALLALVGYSNNDTIIVFDRVRETLHQFPSLKIEEAVNKAVNETLGRTFMTSITTFFTAAALFFYGGEVIHNFAFTLMVGVLVGTYSSIFIASSVLIQITKYQKDREIKIKKSGKKKKKKTYKVRPEPKLS